MAKHSNFVVRGGANFNPLYNEFTKAQKRLGAFQAGLNRTMKTIGITLGSLTVGKLIKDSTKAAMAVESSMDNIARNMGESSEAFQYWVNTQSKGLAMAKDEAYQYGSTFSNLLGSFIKSSQETASETQNLMKVAAIVSSKTGRTYDDVANRIRSGMLGSTEAIEDLGIYTQVSMLESTEAFKKFANGKSWNQLDFQAQQQIRLAAILEQAYSRYGDTLAGTTQTRQQIFLATLKNIRLNLGQAFLPIYNVVLPALTNLASKIEFVTNTLAAFSQALFGKATKVQTKQTQAQAGVVSDLGDATEKAGKQAKGALAGFDEINSLSMNEGGGSGVVGGVGIGTEELLSETDDGTGGAMGTVATKAAEMATKVREAFINMKNAIVENKDIILPALGAIVGAIAGIYLAIKVPAALITITEAFKNMGAIVAKSGGVIKALWGFLAAHPIAAVVIAIGALIGALVTAYLTNDEFRAKVDKLWERIKTALTPVIQKLGEVLLWVWNSVLVPVGRVITDILIVAFDALTYVVKWLWEYVLKPLGDFVINSLVPVLVELAKIVGTVIKLAVEALVKVFEYLWYSVLKPIVVWLGDTFKPVFENIGNSIKTIIQGLQTTFDGLIKFITGVFTGNWRKAWEGVKQIFKGIFDTLYGIAKAPLNMIIDAVNWIIKGLNKIQISIPSWVPGIGGRSFGVNIDTIPKLANGGITDVNNPFMAIVGDNKTQREVISPLDDLKSMIVEAVGSAILGTSEFSDNSNSGDVILQIDGTTFARIINPYNAKENERIGNSVVIQTT